MINWMAKSIQVGPAPRSFHWRALFWRAPLLHKSHTHDLLTQFRQQLSWFTSAGWRFYLLLNLPACKKLSTAIGNRVSARSTTWVHNSGQLELILANCLPYAVRPGIPNCPLELISLSFAFLRYFHFVQGAGLPSERAPIWMQIPRIARFWSFKCCRFRVAAKL